MKQRRIGILGSAFNPPTLGHLDVLQQAAEVFDHILLVPSAAHAFAKEMLPFTDRLKMLEAFMASAGVPCGLEICTTEADLYRQNPEKPVYTFDLLEHLEALYPEAQLGFIRGPDNADPTTWQRFYKAREIEQRWIIFTAEERRPIRSTQVRELLSMRELDDNSIKALASYLFPSVYQCIRENSFYQS